MFTVEIDQTNLTESRNKLQRCKVIALDEMGKQPLQNAKYFTQKERNNLLKRMKELFETETDDEIINKFNDVCNDKIFTGDISNYPVYVDRRYPEQQELFNKEEESISQLKEELKVNKLIE